jgi:hypothetical protein
MDRVGFESPTLTQLSKEGSLSPVIAFPVCRARGVDELESPSTLFFSVPSLFLMKRHLKAFS